MGRCEHRIALDEETLYWGVDEPCPLCEREKMRPVFDAAMAEYRAEQEVRKHTLESPEWVTAYYVLELARERRRDACAKAEEVERG